MAMYYPGELIGERYRVERALGSGGFGDVFEATELGVERRASLGDGCQARTGCEAAVVSCRVDGGYHWPGTRRSNDHTDCPEGAANVDLEQLVWRFFSEAPPLDSSAD